MILKREEITNLAADLLKDISEAHNLQVDRLAQSGTRFEAILLAAYIANQVMGRAMKARLDTAVAAGSWASVEALISALIECLSTEEQPEAQA